MTTPTIGVTSKRHVAAERQVVADPGGAGVWLLVVVAPLEMQPVVVGDERGLQIVGLSGTR